jgi:peptide/nickel transport system permease protein
VSAYLVRRLLMSVLVLFGISILAFSMIHLAPGGPTAIYAVSPNFDARQLERIEALLGLNDPLHIQYIKWLRGVLVGEWGYSYRDGRPVTGVILERVPNTVELTLASMIVAIGLGVPVGIYTAARAGTVARWIANMLTMTAISMPTFWLGLMVILIFAEQLRLIPSGGMFTIGRQFSLADRLRHLIAPALVLGTPSIATWWRYTHSGMVEVLLEDYVRTARAKGLSERIVTYRHALKNVLITLVTLAGLSLPNLFSGALVTEAVFAWPGNGRLLVESLVRRDYPVVMGNFMVIAVLVVAGNLLADVAYALVDPRVRFD